MRLPLFNKYGVLLTLFAVLCQIFDAKAICPPSQPAGINGSVAPCAGSTITYSVVNDPTATDYTWTLPFGWTGASTTNTITVTVGTLSGTLVVTANDGCGPSLPQSVFVTVYNIPVASAGITGNTTVCPASSNTYMAAPVTDALFYNWTSPTGWSGTSNTNIIQSFSTDTGGDFTVIAGNYCGLSSATTLSVSVATFDTSVAQSGTTLSANLTGATYQWFNCTRGLTVFGATSQSFTPTLTGSYQVLLSKNGCNVKSRCHIVNTGVGIDEDVENISIQMHPNPAATRLTIEAGSQKIEHVEIFSIIGERVNATVTYFDNTIELNLEHLASGMYFVKWNSGNTSHTTKFVKE